MENLVLGIIFTVFAVIMLIIGALKKTAQLQDADEYVDNTLVTPVFAVTILFGLIAGLHYAKAVDWYFDDSVKSEDKTDPVNATAEEKVYVKKVYVKDYINDGNDNILTYSVIIKGNNDNTTNTAMFRMMNVDESVLKVNNLSKIVSSNEKTPYVTYKLYSEVSADHFKQYQSGDSTLHLPKDVLPKADIVSNTD